MHIDLLLNAVNNQINEQSNTAIIQFDKSWEQGRTIFGGISAAVVYQAIYNKVSTDRVLRSLTTNFVGPIVYGADVHIDVDVLRQGKNVTQVVAKAMQNDQVCLMVQASFGVARDSKINIPSTLKHQFEPPKKAKFIPQIPKVVPNYLKHLDISLSEGKMPFMGSKSSSLHGFMRFTKAPEKVTDAHIIALIDGWPPAVLQMLRWPAPASSMSWNLEFIHPHREIKGSDWFSYQSTTRQAADGYAHTEANIWDAHGELIAISRQCVTIFT